MASSSSALTRCVRCDIFGIGTPAINYVLSLYVYIPMKPSFFYMVDWAGRCRIVQK
ncbi:hypothetical protein YC2023_039836 [Brassica napus]